MLPRTSANNSNVEMARRNRNVAIKLDFSDAAQDGDEKERKVTFENPAGDGSETARNPRSCTNTGRKFTMEDTLNLAFLNDTSALDNTTILAEGTLDKLLPRLSKGD
eukprot:1016037_1